MKPLDHFLKDCNVIPSGNCNGGKAYRFSTDPISYTSTYFADHNTYGEIVIVEFKDESIKVFVMELLYIKAIRNITT